MWSQSYIILSSSFEGRSLSTFFSVLLLLCLPLSVSPGLNFALQLFPLNLPPLTYQLPTLSSKQLFTPYNVLLFSFPSDAAQWLAKPGHTSVCWGMWNILGWGWGGLCLVCFREQSKRSTWEEVLGQGWGIWRIFSCLGKMKEEGRQGKEHGGNSGQSVPVFSCGGCQPTLLYLWSDLGTCSCYPCPVTASCPPHGFPCKSNLFLMGQPAVPHLSLPCFSWSQQFSIWLGKAGEDGRNVSQDCLEEKMLKNCCYSSHY